MHTFLPADFARATLIGRMMTPEGPAPVAVKHGRLHDLSRVFPTVSDLFEGLAPGEACPDGVDLGPIEDREFTPAWRGGSADRLLAPIDLQVIKASGVTFATSALERVIEERALGDSNRASEIRDGIQQRIGSELRAVVPGSTQAEALKRVLIGDGYWSQYLEVAIGPHAEIFTKAPVLAAVGWGEDVGVREDSEWNNPEPEVVVLCDSKGRARGASLGNDVNLRDIEGRSALLLGKAKDNNASCSLGPFIRLFDDAFTMDDVRQAEVSLEIQGEDNYRLEGSSNMGLISRDPLELIRQTIGPNHQYPDGFVLFMGTMFAPVEDRDTVGSGFTHKTGDVVKVSSPKLGVLENRVVPCSQATPWTFGIRGLMRNLAERGLLRP
jgi:fumarylacetoacetate (FAA) hydrolase family protein